MISHRMWRGLGQDVPHSCWDGRRPGTHAPFSQPQDVTYPNQEDAGNNIEDQEEKAAETEEEKKKKGS